MYFAPYFSIAFVVNFGVLAALGWASGDVLWAQDARLLGCLGYSALVALVFALSGLQAPALQRSREPAQAVAAALNQAPERLGEASQPTSEVPRPSPNKALPVPAEHELA